MTTLVGLVMILIAVVTLLALFWTAGYGWAKRKGCPKQRTALDRDLARIRRQKKRERRRDW